MYIRDHQRPAFHKALGVDVDWYAEEVFTKTSELSKQIFPITLDIDNPKWFEKVRRLQKVNVELAEAKKNKNRFKQLWFSSRAAFIFVSLWLYRRKATKYQILPEWSLHIDGRLYFYSYACSSISMVVFNWGNTLSCQDNRKF
jgi:magnesium-protoporphyrin IX monomethyl ester (oxidative) cyclase